MLGVGMRARFSSALAAGGLLAGLAVALPEAASGGSLIRSWGRLAPRRLSHRQFR